MLILRQYLGGERLVIRTEHDDLRWILNKAYETVKLARWRFILTELSFDVLHRAGVKNQAEDALIRMETTETETKEMEDEFTSYFVEMKEEMDE